MPCLDFTLLLGSWEAGASQQIGLLQLYSPVWLS